MEAVVDLKYQPVFLMNGGGMAAAAKKTRLGAPALSAAGGETETGVYVYRECLKNHAASLGGHALDGCGEFTPSREADPAFPSSLSCAACGCHRNFHRRLAEVPPPPPLLALPPPPPPPPLPPSPAPAPAQAPAAASHATRGSRTVRGEEAPVTAAFDEGTEEESDEGSDSDEDDRTIEPQLAPIMLPPGFYDGAKPHKLLSTGAPRKRGALRTLAARRNAGWDFDEDRTIPPEQAPTMLPPGFYDGAKPHKFLSSGAPRKRGAQTRTRAAPPPPPPAFRGPMPAAAAPGTAVPPADAGAAPTRKRSRTMFSPEQKQRMRALSERLGWRLQKYDEAVLDECCGEIGVSKGVFKVWMHNKHNFVEGPSARRTAASAMAKASAATVLHHPSDADAAAGAAYPSTPPPPQQHQHQPPPASTLVQPSTASNGGWS